MSCGTTSTYLRSRRHLQHWEAFDPASSTLSQLVDALDDSVERTRRLYEIHFLIWLPFMAAISLFDDFYRDVLGGVSEFDAYRLLQGFDNKTVESGRALWQLSRRALQVAAVRAVLEQEPAEAVTAALEETPEGRRFLDLLDEYLQTWGQRGDRWGWSFPSWIEDPTPVIRTLKDYVRQPDRDLEGEMAAQVAEREQLVSAARERLRSHPPDVVNRFEFLLKAAQKAIVLTEDHSHWIDFRCMYHLHRISLEVGRRLSAAGVVDRPDDVFLLTLEELARHSARIAPAEPAGPDSSQTRRNGVLSLRTRASDARCAGYWRPTHRPGQRGAVQILRCTTADT